MTQLAALFALISYVLAAPSPLGSVNVADLNSIFPIFNSSGNLKNVTRLADTVSAFPPGPRPPGQPFFYTVPRSNPKIVVEFVYFEFNLERDESQIYEVFRQAFYDASDPNLRDTAVPDRRHLYFYHDADLEMTPEKGEPEQVPFLTWGLWHTALTGINNFRRFYPGLNFEFEIYVDPPEDDDVGFSIGHGYLDG